MTLDQITAAIALADTAAETALTLVGQPELTPVVAAAALLATKLVTLVDQHTALTSAALQAAVQAVRVEVDAQEALKFK